MSDPTCVNCKHIRVTGPGNFGTKQYSCAVEPNKMTPVTGERGLDCVNARSTGSQCGPSGVNFEQQEGM